MADYENETISHLNRLTPTERRKDLLSRTVTLVEVLHSTYDHFLTCYHAGEFESDENMREFVKMLDEFAQANRVTADMFSQIKAIVEKTCNV